MPLTRTKFHKLLRTVISLSILALIIVYAIWRSFAYARGPMIQVFSPQNGVTLATSSIEVVGRALRINSLKINGNSISLDEQGNFKERRALFPGMNIITIVASDQFGRSVQKELRLVGAPSGSY